jgi:hypothetical protein
MGERSGAYRVMMRKQRKRPHERHRYRWKATVKINLQEIEWERLGWTDMVRERNMWWAVVETVMNLRRP